MGPIKTTRITYDFKVNDATCGYIAKQDRYEIIPWEHDKLMIHSSTIELVTHNEQG